MLHRCRFRAGVAADPSQPGEVGGADGGYEANVASGTGRPRAELTFIEPSSDATRQMG